ncbi:hypothetical protein [Micromonospora okii]|uniref:hypothetical protein n=1 Tax=Micromonospora okii TaxID=1182970 RepID=UPI001E32EC50|nr:hypothetical protein [Micromonospora okii]
MSTARPASTTRRTLRWFLRALLAGTAVALAGCLAVFLGVHRTTAAAHDRSVPAVLAVYDAQIALREAHGAAQAGLTSGTRLLAGPGEDYQNLIARAGQHLAQAAEDNAAGDAGSRDLQVVQASLVTYTGLIERAHAHVAQDGGGALGVATLWDAATLLEEILRRLDGLRAKQADALADQVDGAWTSGATTLLWLGPVLVLLALLVAAQRFLRARFRRRLNVPLLLATLAVVGMGATAALSLRSADQLADARAETDRAAGLREARLDALADRDTAGLTALLTRACRPKGCPETIARVDPEGLRVPAPSAPVDGMDAADGAEAAHERHDRAATTYAARAADSRGGEVGLLAAALLVMALVVVGLLPRLEEYRYRQR